MLQEVRITGLGVIDEAVLELSAGFNVVTGEPGRARQWSSPGWACSSAAALIPRGCGREPRAPPSRAG